MLNFCLMLQRHVCENFTLIAITKLWVISSHKSVPNKLAYRHIPQNTFYGEKANCSNLYTWESGRIPHKICLTDRSSLITHVQVLVSLCTKVIDNNLFLYVPWIHGRIRCAGVAATPTFFTRGGSAPHFYTSIRYYYAEATID